MTILRRFLRCCSAAVLLSACGETDVPGNRAGGCRPKWRPCARKAVEPTPEPTQTPRRPRPWPSTASNATKDAPAGHRPFHLERRQKPSWRQKAGKAVCPLRHDPCRRKEGTPCTVLAVNRDANVRRSTPPTRTAATRCPLWLWCAAAAWTPRRVFFATPVGFHAMAAA